LTALIEPVEITG